jgi:flagellar protein FliS
MFSAYQHATRAYRDIGLETGAAGADPVGLIVMLYDGAIDALTQGLAGFESGNVPARQAAISRAIRIVDEGLSGSLSEVGGDITRQLRELYGYMTRRMLSSSLTLDPAPLAEVRKLLKELRGAWGDIAPAAAGRAGAPRGATAEAR